MTSPKTQDSDAQAAKELANLLGRELVQAKQRVTQLQKQLQAKKKARNQSKAKQLDDRASRASGVVSQLQREVEKYKQDELSLKQKIEGLRTEHRNLRNKEKEVRRLRDEIAKLKTQREAAGEEARKLKQVYAEDKQRGKELRKIMAGKEANNGQASWNDILSTMSALPLWPTRPPHGTLAPIAKRGIQLPHYLRYDPKTEKYAEAALFIPGRFTWCASAGGYHHALAFGPTHIFNTRSRRWEVGSVMERLYGQTRELFYEEKTDVIYAGTYKCIQLNNSIINWPEPGVDGLLPYIMTETALSEDFPNAPCTTVHKGTVTKLYRDGVLKVECMGLRCVGFNKELYQDLVARHCVQSPVKGKKRLESTEEDKANKRRRI